MLPTACCLALAGALAVAAASQSQPAAASPLACAVSANQSLGGTEDCGWQGIDEGDCRSRGCCYGPLDPNGAPKCFRRLVSRRLQEDKDEFALESIPPQCVMPDAKRVDCGFTGIRADECVGKGCCYYKGTPGHPYCYFKKGQAPSDALVQARQCEALDEERIDCGYDGVSEGQCQERGCCYERALTPGAPFCYYKRHQAPEGAVKGSAKAQCVMSDADREDCGFKGVTPEACRAKGCCYFHSHTRGSPFCYYESKNPRARAGHGNASRCDVPGEHRKDCGFVGISSPECEAQGCCYGHSSVKSAPFCYYKGPPSTDARHGANASTDRHADHHGDAHRGSRKESHPTEAPEAHTTDAARTHEGPVIVTAEPTVHVVQTAKPAEDMAARGRQGQGGEDMAAQSGLRGQGHSTSGDGSNSKQTLMTALAACAILLVVITGCCLRTGASQDTLGEEHVPLKDPSNNSPKGATTKRLEPGSNLYGEFERMFVERWSTTTWPTCAGRAVPPPRIRAIYEVDVENRLPAYKAKQREIESSSCQRVPNKFPDNEQVTFHGARCKCDYQGSTCLDIKCAVCRIIDSGSFARDSISGEIHFREGSHAAKGQGLAPGKTPPPESLDDFVSSSAGNAVFVANVLLGTPQIVTERTKGPLPSGTHSRIAEKAYGVDEIVVFDEAQAIPRALILFH